MVFDALRKLRPGDFELDKMPPDKFLASFKDMSQSDDAMLIKYLNAENLEIIKAYFCKK